MLDQDVPNRRRYRAACMTGHQFPRGLSIQRSQLEGWDTGCVELGAFGFPRIEEQRDPFRSESASDEQEGIGRRRVEPLGVVDEAQHRSVFGELRKESQTGNADEESISTSCVRQAQRAANGVGLRWWKAFKEVEHRSRELMEPRERKVGLGLYTAGGEDTHVGRLLTRILEQSGLADAWFSLDDERAAAGGTRRLQQRADARTLGVTTQEHHSSVGPPQPGSFKQPVISLMRRRVQSGYHESVPTSGQHTLGGRAANAVPSTIVLIHGLWLTARSWERWIERYTDLGYRVLAPSWPSMESEVERLNTNPSTLASLTAEHICDHYESIIIEIERPPIVMGHSLGGTFTQILLDRGLGAAGVCVASATVEGTRDIPLRAIKVASPALGPFRRGEPVPLTALEFHYAFANTMSREESNALHARYAVPAPGGLLAQHAFANFRDARPPKLAADNREARAPLLFIGFGADHVMPSKLVHAGVETSVSNSVTEFVEFPGRPHYLGAPGWESVADYALTWAVRHASRSTVPADLVTKNAVEGESS